MADTKPLSADRIADYRALRAGITPGPWLWVQDRMIATDVPEGREAREDDREYLADRPSSSVVIIETDSGYYPPRKADREFIASAPQIVDDLLAENERLEAENARLRVENADARERFRRMAIQPCAKSEHCNHCLALAGYHALSEEPTYRKPARSPRTPGG